MYVLYARLLYGGGGLDESDSWKLEVKAKLEVPAELTPAHAIDNELTPAGSELTPVAAQQLCSSQSSRPRRGGSRGGTRADAKSRWVTSLLCFAKAVPLPQARGQIVPVPHSPARALA